MPAESAQAIALVRLRISDVQTTPDKQLLTDQQIHMLLEEHGSSVYRASADALRTIAISEVLVGKVIRTQELQTNADRVAESLRKIAAEYDAKADAQEAEIEGALHFIPPGGSSHLETEERRRSSWDGDFW